MTALTMLENTKQTTQRSSSITALTVSTKILMQMLNCGKPTAIKIGTAAGAKIVIGRKILWNVSVIQCYLNSIAE